MLYKLSRELAAALSTAVVWVQADRNTMVLFVHGRGHAIMQGPKKVYPAQTVAEMIAANGDYPVECSNYRIWTDLNIDRATPCSGICLL